MVLIQHRELNYVLWHPNKVIIYESVIMISSFEVRSKQQCNLTRLVALSSHKIGRKSLLTDIRIFHLRHLASKQIFPVAAWL
jgi:hypothetical protein